MIQRRLAWPLCKDDMQIREAFHIFKTKIINFDDESTIVINFHIPFKKKEKNNRCSEKGQDRRKGV